MTLVMTLNMTLNMTLSASESLCLPLNLSLISKQWLKV